MSRSEWTTLDQQTIPNLARLLNARCSTHDIGRLQSARQRLKGLKRVRPDIIFCLDNANENWAFHFGGRDELQFNVAKYDRMDPDCDLVRWGVGFSFQKSRSFHDIGPVLPKVDRFSDYI